MSLSSNPSYQALAATAANALGNPSPSIIKAILAQWQCELGNVPYPPTRNNPGNVAKGYADGLGIPYRIDTPNPQPSNPIVTFYSVNDGARAYAGGIRTYRRYALVRQAIARGDGRGFLIAITAAGWGTNITCALRVYAGETGSVNTTPNADPVSSTTPVSGVLEEFLAQIHRSISDPIRDEDVIPFIQFLQSKHIAPGGDPANSPGVAAIERVMRGLVGQPWSAAGAAFLGAAGAPNDPFGIGAALQGFAAALGGLAGSLAVNGAVLALILILAFSGFRDVLNGGEA